MTLDEFEYIIKRKSGFDKYFVCFGFLLFGLYLIVEGMKNVKGTSNKLLFALLPLFQIVMSLYAFVILKNRHKVKLWYNTLTKEQNIELLEWLLPVFKKPVPTTPPAKDHIYFIHKRSWWGLSYSIHLYADKNRIAIHVDSTSYRRKGMVDLGASRRLQNKILAMMEKRSSIYLNNA